MKHKHLLPLGLLAGVAVALLAPSAHAQRVGFTNGDLVLGFEETTGPNSNSYDYEVNLGPASYFLTLAASPGTTDITTADFGGAGLGNIAADLANGSKGFGSDWYENSSTAGDNVQWGVFGAILAASNNTGLAQNTLFETIAEQTPGQLSSAPGEGSPSSQQPQTSAFQSFSTTLGNGNDTANSDYGTFISNSSATSWSGENASSSAFNGPVGIEQPTSGTYIGPTNSELDLWELIPSGGTGYNGNGTLLGSFTLDSSGNLDFTSAAVPEPSTYAAIGLGAAFLLLFRRTRKSLRA